MLNLRKAISFSLFFSIVPIYLLYQQQNQSVRIVHRKEPNASKSNELKKIIVWSTWTDYWGKYWKQFSDHCPEIREQCEFYVAKNQTLATQADAVLFSVGEWIPGKKTIDAPRIRRPEQIYVFYHGESPAHTHGNLQLATNFFNATMSHRTDSDIWWPYGHFVPAGWKTAQENPPNYGDLQELARNRTKMAAWWVSRCHSHSKREKYVEELQNHGVPVDIFGKCGRSCPWDEVCEEKLARDYKFYIGFENSVCDDYTTEKFYFRLQQQVVLLVLRAKDYEKISPEGFLVAPENSYIAADNFTNVKQLAEYLKYLDKNHEAYLKYFEWQKKYQVIKYYGSNLGICKLCKMIQHQPATKVYPDIRKWWFGSDEKPVCEPNFAEKFL